MIKILIPLFFIFFHEAFSQLTTIPVYPTQNDSIIIYLDATQPGAEELLNYSGTLYAHTGVNTNLGTWQHVIGSWGNNQAQPSLIRLGANQYQLTIGYPRQFYSVTNASEQIAQLAIVIRSSDGTKQTDPDIFLDLYKPGLSVVVNNPQVSVQFGDPLRSPAFAASNDTVNINISAAEIGTKAASITLFINDLQKAQTSSNELSFDFIAEDYSNGSNSIKAVGIDTAGITDTSSFILFVNPPVENAQPPEGIINGINYIDDNTVVLSLFAPYKDFIYVIGDFNDWKINSDYFMKKHEINPDSVIWWLNLNSLTAGEEYIFQYLVNGNLRIADPFTEKVSDTNDHEIASSVYPGLKSYPSGKTAEPASYIQTAQPPYQWEVNHFERPKKTDLVIYELLVRDFLQTHSYKTLIDTLGYLKRLGVNAIELMPVMEFEGNQSWGYNTSFHFAPDKYYGTKNDLKKFIDEAHKNGIAVILDIVLNHVYGQSPLVRLYWNPTMSRPATNSPWFNQISPNQTFSFGFDFNHERQLVKNYVDRVNKFWLEEYNIDGYRFDFTKGFTQTSGDGGGFDQSRINILNRMANEIKKVDSTAYIILEHFAPNSEETILQNSGMMLWGNVNCGYNQGTMGHPSGPCGTWDLSRVSHKSRGWANPNLVGYMESHDEERLMYKNLQFGNASGNYNVKNLLTALQRIKLAAAFFFTVPGPKMIWQFGELGYDVSIDFNGRVGNKPIRWNYFDEPARRKLYQIFAALTELKQYDAFESNNFTLNASGSVKRLNLQHESMDVYVIGNFDVTAKTANHSFSKRGSWYNYFTGDSIFVADSIAQVTLEPGEFFLYTSVKIPGPDTDIITDVKDTEESNLLFDFRLEQNYPNPFNPATNFEFQIPNSGLVIFKIFDVLGKEVTTLVKAELSPGKYNIRFDASHLSSGIYFYRIEAGNFIQTRKMILIR